MLLLSHFLEAVYLARELALSTNSPLLRLLAAFVPRLGADVVNLQPSLFGLTMVHLVFDDSRARLPPEEGGLGYRGALSTIEGMCRLVNGHRKGGGGGPRSEKGGFGLGLLKAQRGLRRMWSTIAGGRMKVE